MDTPRLFVTPSGRDADAAGHQQPLGQRGLAADHLRSRPTEVPRTLGKLKFNVKGEGHPLDRSVSPHVPTDVLIPDATQPMQH